MGKKYRSFEINFPEWLMPLYNNLQEVLDEMAKDTNYLTYLINNEDLSKKNRGNIWNLMRPHYQDQINKINHGNKAWYGNMLCENIRRELYSKVERIELYDLLKEYAFETSSDFYEELNTKELDYTAGILQNLIRSKERPKPPESITLQMDFSCSASQMFTIDENYKCNIQLTDKSWQDYQIYAPVSVREQYAGEIAKPKFIKNKETGKTNGFCSYRVKHDTHTKFKNIMGVDIGMVKLFSVSILYSNGSYSKEFVCSKYTDSLTEKLKVLYDERNILYRKLKRSKNNGYGHTEKNKKRKKNLQFIRNKIKNLKSQIIGESASELVKLALDHEVKEIHIENLAWLESKAGKWNHSEFHKKLKSVANLHGVKVCRVSAKNSSKEHPITKEIGRVSGRNIIFSNGERIDRDRLASINLAVRTMGKENPNNPLNEVKKDKNSPSRAIRNKRRDKIRKIVNSIRKKGEQIVTFPPRRSGRDSLCQEAWLVLIENTKRPNNSLCDRFPKNLSQVS